MRTLVTQFSLPHVVPPVLHFTQILVFPSQPIIKLQDLTEQSRTWIRIHEHSDMYLGGVETCHSLKFRVQMKTTLNMCPSIYFSYQITDNEWLQRA